jgi:flagellar M-ring protein FliF
MKGVESASVLYDEKKTGGFGQKVVCTSSVNIKPMGSQPLEEERIPMIRHLVASAFAGLNPNNVSVTDLNGRNYSSSTEDGGLGTASEDPYITRKHKHEQLWEHKIRDQLEYIPGVVVSTNVELSLDTEYEETKTSLDPKGVIYSSDESATSKTSEAGALRGRVGFVAQQPGGANQPGSVSETDSGNKTSEETSKVSNQTAIPTTVQKRRQQGLTPERVKVAVAVPTSYYSKVWQERNPPAEGQPAAKPDTAAIAEIERQVKDDIKNAVVALLPVSPPGEDPFPQVTVTSFQHIAVTPPAPPAIQDKAMAWLGQYWSTMAMSGLGLVSLLMLRSLVRATPSPAIPPMTPHETSSAPTILSLTVGDDPIESGASVADEAATPRNRLKRRAANGGPSLREELATLVKEDPDSAVAVLRNWIGASA